MDRYKFPFFCYEYWKRKGNLQRSDMKKNIYYIKFCDIYELEVTKDQFIDIEMFCGFFPKIYGETATSGFGFYKNGLNIFGRIEYQKEG